MQQQVNQMHRQLSNQRNTRFKLSSSITLVGAMYDNATTYYRSNGELVTFSEALAQGAEPAPLLNDPLGLNPPTLIASDGSILQTASGVFTYLGDRYSIEDATEVDGVYYMPIEETGEFEPVGITGWTAATLLYNISDVQLVDRAVQR